MKTRNTKLGVIAITLLSAAMPFTAKAQDKVKASVGADIVSGYIWRGQDLGGVSLQPNASIAYKGLSLEAWGSVGIEKTDADGYDAKSSTSHWATPPVVLAYQSLIIGIIPEPGYFHYGAHNTTHLYEAQVGYDFGPVAVNWYTNFAGDDGVKENGDRAYSSYISIAAPFKLGGLDWTAEVGATPWETGFYGASGFAVSDVSIRSYKGYQDNQFILPPLFAKATWNPCSERAYFVVGLSF